MSSGPPTDRDRELLGIGSGADLAEVQEAYRQRRQVYDWDSLATYNLLSEDERRTMLQRIDDAYQRVIAALPQGPGTAVDPSADATVPASAPEAPPQPDPHSNPGDALRHRRIARGLTIKCVSEETKISGTMIDRLESQDFARLPATVYVRGFVIQYARLLDFDEPERMAGSYLALMARR